MGIIAAVKWKPNFLNEVMLCEIWLNPLSNKRKSFLPVYNETSHMVNYYNPKKGRIETLVFRLPPYRLFLGVGMGMEKNSLGMKQMLCGFSDIFALLSR